jgi:hypothetical protein
MNSERAKHIRRATSARGWVLYKTHIWQTVAVLRAQAQLILVERRWL